MFWEIGIRDEAVVGCGCTQGGESTGGGGSVGCKGLEDWVVGTREGGM